MQKLSANFPPPSGQWSETVQRILLAQPLNPLECATFSVANRRGSLADPSVAGSEPVMDGASPSVSEAARVLQPL